MISIAIETGERALIDFFVKEAKQPVLSDWLSLLSSIGIDDKDSKIAAFSALLLSNLLANATGYQPASNTLHDFYLNLGSKKLGHEEYGEWLRSGWLNAPRIANAVKFCLKVSA